MDTTEATEPTPQDDRHIVIMHMTTTPHLHNFEPIVLHRDDLDDLRDVVGQSMVVTVKNLKESPPTRITIDGSCILAIVEREVVEEDDL